jgi:peptidoglycan/xylan/chitin deacetylase (PgdA/CDA1 family)
MLAAVRSEGKRWVQRAVRAAHLLVPRDLPDRLGIYFHDLQPADWFRFSAAAAHLGELGYAFGGPHQLHQADGKKVCWISFDDNYRSWHESLGTLAAIGVTATFFVSTAPIRDRSSEAERIDYARRIGRSPSDFETLSTTEIAEIAAAGHTVGSHSHSHRDLGSLPANEARAEVLMSKQILEEIIGEPVVHFSYPYGTRRRFTEELRDYCRSIGFETVASGTPGMQHVPQQPDRLNRTRWDLDRSIDHNIANLRVDGRWFERVTGRSPMPG